MNARMRRVIVFVGDVDACANWYAERLGLAKIDTTHQTGHVV